MPDDTIAEAKALGDLADAMDALSPPLAPNRRSGVALKFLLHREQGFCIGSSRAVAQTLCMIWNHRALIAKALRAYGEKAK